MYSISEDKWTQGPTMVIPRTNHSCCILSDMLYAISGSNEEGSLNSIEKLDVSKWLKQCINGLKWQLIQIKG